MKRVVLLFASLFPMSALAGPCSPAVQTRIDGDFEGWEGETVYSMVDGSVWKQKNYHYHYHYFYRPSVTIYEKDSLTCHIVVQGDDDSGVDVELISGIPSHVSSSSSASSSSSDAYNAGYAVGQAAGNLAVGIGKSIAAHKAKKAAENMEWRPKLKKGETFMDSGDGTGWACKGKEPQQCRKVEGPMAVRLHLAMEDMRKMLDEAKDYPADSLIGMLQPGHIKLWSDLRDSYCQDAPGAKYMDLSGAEQKCK